MRVTRTWLRSQVEQGEPTDTGEWFTLDLDALREQRFRYLEIHLPDQEDDPGPNDVRLIGQERGDPPRTSPDQVFYLTLTGLENAVDAARDHGGYQPWNEMAVAVHAAFTAAGAQVPALNLLLNWTEGRKWWR